MRRFIYTEIYGKSEPMDITVSEEWIRIMYFPKWKSRMKKLNRTNRISMENCIKDFMIINWAWEL